MPLDAGLGRWSIHQVVIHLLDSDLIGIDRMKRMIAEDRPLLIGYDETKFASSLFYHEQSVETAVTVVDLCRRNFAAVLGKLPLETFQRWGVHNEIGKVTLGDQIEKYDHHLDHHIKFIHEKRKKLGNPARA